MIYQPLVSIIITNFNYADFLGEAIDSAINQTYSNTEVIVVDDGSTDDSKQIISSYGDRLISVFKENGGQASAFNAGFAASKGEIICLLDSDDVFVTEKALEITKIFRENSAIEWCFHSLSLVEKSSGLFLADSYGGSSRKCDFRQQMKNGKLSFLAPATSGLCFKRSLLEQILPVDEVLKCDADRYIVLITPALAKGFYLDKKLSIQGVHQNNINTSKEGEIFDRKRAYRASNAAYFMKMKLPEFYKIADRTFARGLGSFWKIKPRYPEEKELINNYFSNATSLSKIKIHLIALYHNRPWKMKSYKIHDKNK